MLVVDGCNPPDPPEARVKIPGQTDFYKEDDTIFYVASQHYLWFFFFHSSYVYKWILNIMLVPVCRFSFGVNY